jgi:hypothetical protein
MSHPMARGAAALPQLGVAAQRRQPELGVLRLGDSPLLAAVARDTVRVTAWRGCYLRSSS